MHIKQGILELNLQVSTSTVCNGSRKWREKLSSGTHDLLIIVLNGIVYIAQLQGFSMSFLHWNAEIWIESDVYVSDFHSTGIDGGYWMLHMRHIQGGYAGILRLYLYSIS